MGWLVALPWRLVQRTESTPGVSWARAAVPSGGCRATEESGKDCADAAYHISPYAAAKGHHQRLDHILARCRWIDFA